MLMKQQQPSDPLESTADLDAFFRTCDAFEGPMVEPDWEEHLMVINETLERGGSKT